MLSFCSCDKINCKYSFDFVSFCLKVRRCILKPVQMQNCCQFASVAFDVAKHEIPMYRIIQLSFYTCVQTTMCMFYFLS